MKLIRVICSKCDGEGEAFRYWKYWLENIFTTGIKPELMRLRGRYYACYMRTCDRCGGKGYVEKTGTGREWEADDCRSGDWI